MGQPKACPGITMPRDGACLMFHRHGRGDLWGGTPHRAHYGAQIASLPAYGPVCWAVPREYLCSCQNPFVDQSHVRIHSLSSPVLESLLWPILCEKCCSDQSCVRITAMTNPLSESMD